MNDLYQYERTMVFSSSDENPPSARPFYVYRQVEARRGSVYDRPYINSTDPTNVSSSKNFFSLANGDSSMFRQENNQKSKPTVRRQLWDNFFDILAIAATCLIFGLIYALIKPFRRGFFCDDTSIQYPYRSDTVPMWMLGLYGGLAPLLIFFVVEFWVVRPFDCGSVINRNTLKHRRIDYLKTMVQTIFLFGLGAAVCFLITEVGKRTIGRLRPHYLTLCSPDWSKIACTKSVTTLNGVQMIYQYVTEHNCTSTATESQLQEARLSFPSGHSSFSTYAFVFLFVYFEARLLCPKMKFLRPFLQCLCIAIAFFTCLSRVTDYKHHPSDVIGGAILGFSVAVFTAVRVGTYLWSFSVYCETDQGPARDEISLDDRVPVPGIELRSTGNSTLPVNRSTRIAPTTHNSLEDRL